MIQCIARYWTSHVVTEEGSFHFVKVTELEIAKIGHLIRPVVARACSIRGGLQFTEADVEWIPQPYFPGTLGVPNFAIELRTSGGAEQKMNLNHRRIIELKRDILSLPNTTLNKLDPAAPLLWVHVVDHNSGSRV